jgi:NADH-quinone oxidoreductase subunit C
MANDSEEKQPPDQSAGGQSSAPKPPQDPEAEVSPDLEWNVRAHPVVAWKPAPVEATPPPKKEAPAAPPAQPAVAAPPKPPAAAAPPAAAPEAKPAAAAAPPSAPPSSPAASAAPPGEGGEPKPAAPATPPKPPAPAGAAPPKAPTPPPPPKEAPPKPEPLDNELVQRFKARFGEVIREAWLDRKQAILVVAREKLAEIAQYARDEEKFDFLTDLTAVDWPKREQRFDVILNLYSFPKNERLRLKAQAAENEPVPSVTGVWRAANWLEREAYDMFGIRFEGHPDLRRILLPDEWQGHPLRKDYDILTQDTAWVRENLGIESGQ